MLQKTVAGFEVRCCVSQRLHQARRGVYSCVQAAAAARVAGEPDILKSAEDGDGVLVLCHLISDAEGVNKRDKRSYNLPTAPLCPSFLCSKSILLFFFRKFTPLHLSAREGYLDVCHLLLNCNADVQSKANQ